MSPRPRLEACFFPGSSRWRRMAAVLEYSAKRHCPGWDVNVEEVPGPTDPSPLGMPAHAANTRKLDWWADRVVSAADGAQQLLVDADVVVLRPLDDLWEMDFDLAYTGRPPGARFPLNAGVVAVRACEGTRALFGAWVAENAQVLRARRESARARYGGCNQAALGSLFEQMSWLYRGSPLSGPVGPYLSGSVGPYAETVLPPVPGAPRGAMVAVRRLECSEWNCENSTWPTCAAQRDGVRILHVKNKLRERVFGRMGRPPDPLPHLQPLAEMWLDVEREIREVNP